MPDRDSRCSVDRSGAARRRRRATVSGGWKIVDSKELALECARIADDRKGEDTLVLDMRKLSSVSDYFVLSTGVSSKQLQAMADSIRQHWQELGLGKGVCQGYESGAWILLEAEDVVVHLLRHEMRRFYDLESLWTEAKHVAWRKRAATKTETGT
ncbi:MAG: ribosome silencing factor [Planctomycetes bacterium]|nr:ribosome silencing factor [Planctomycetota bacterium]